MDLLHAKMPPRTNFEDNAYGYRPARGAVDAGSYGHPEIQRPHTEKWNPFGVDWQHSFSLFDIDFRELVALHLGKAARGVCPFLHGVQRVLKADRVRLKPALEVLGR